MIFPPRPHDSEARITAFRVMFYFGAAILIIGIASRRVFIAVAIPLLIVGLIGLAKQGRRV